MPPQSAQAPQGPHAPQAPQVSQGPQGPGQPPQGPQGVQPPLGAHGPGPQGAQAPHGTHPFPGGGPQGGGRPQGMPQPPYAAFGAPAAGAAGHDGGWGTPPQQAPAFGSSAWWTMRRKLAAVGAAAALAVGAGGVGAVAATALSGTNTVYGSPTAVSGASTKGGTTAQVAAAVQPSVVSIQARTGTGGATGSGVILRSDGVIMTNAHVVANAQQLTVKFSDGKTASAKLLGSSTANDIAVIQAQGVSGLKPVTLGDSSALAVGDQVLAIGSPLGLDGSVTSGIVSALGREINEGDSGDDGGGQDQQLPPGLRGQVTEQESAVIKNAIQTDAAINPGNSGGALVNGAGQLIGINTAIATSGQNSGSIGVGFAIPVNDAKKVAEKIIQGSAG
ncbi:trypsin-like peptidase domain-containing protein [Actinomadura barringtoniae]|uniref:Trypsin-like peptidase domain-containing protein n=2 Tax=Actinomadura barringtoniae TaxID=1427535 RepID=A0A939T9H3_9ACTN|nr:trypsin-like peptidase domain-containing protein [Actinomadura barringtoniae]